MLVEGKEKEKSAHQQTLEAKAGMHQREAVPGGAKAETRLANWVGRVSVATSLLLILSVWFATRRGVRPQSPTATQHSPMILVDEVEQLPPLEWKAIPLSLPYGGMVDIDVQVIRGNPIDVFVTTSDQFDILKKVEWNSLKKYEDISATETRTFRRTGWLGQGGFYLVVRDMTVGVPSSQPSDISVKVRLNP